MATAFVWSLRLVAVVVDVDVRVVVGVRWVRLLVALGVSGCGSGRGGRCRGRRARDGRVREGEANRFVVVGVLVGVAVQKRSDQTVGVQLGVGVHVPNVA